MLERLRTHFLTLTIDEADVMMRAFVLYRGLRSQFVVQDVEQLWLFLKEAKVYHSELISPLLSVPECRVIVSKLLGAVV